MKEFHKLESASGLLLIAATILALILANIPSTLEIYNGLLGLHLTITLGGLGVDKPLLVVIDGRDKPFRTTLSDADYATVRRLEQTRAEVLLNSQRFDEALALLTVEREDEAPDWILKALEARESRR